jgi:methionyl-tRNA formyltransferase
VTDPYPGAFTFASDVRVTLWSARHAQPSRRLLDRAAAAEAVPGTVLCDGTPNAVVVCGDRQLLELRDVQVGDRRGGPADFPGVIADGVVLGGGA